MNENRELPVRCETGRRKKRLILAAAILLFVLLAGGGIFLVTQMGNQTQKFSPPPLDSAAVAGEPSPAKELGYGMAEADKGFRFGLCGALKAGDNNTVPVYLTNPADNQVWLLATLWDEEGNLLGTTGILKPGQWVENLPLTSPPTKGEQNVTIKISGYEPETYVSQGSASLSTKLTT